MKTVILGLLLQILFARPNYAANIQISGNGVGSFRIGKSPPDLKREMLVFRRLEKDENEVSHEIIRARLNRALIDAEVYNHKIWRITSTSNKIETVEGITVGAHAKNVLYKNEYITPEIGSGPVIVLVSTKPCGLSYVTDAAIADEFNGLLTRASAGSILESAKITKIYVTGCE